MSLQIIKKFIGADAVDGSKIKLLNNQALRARNAADSADLSILKLNASNDLVLNASEIDMSAAVLKNMSEMRATEVKIGASQLAIIEDSISTGQSGGIDANTELMMHFNLTDDADSSGNNLTVAYVHNAIITAAETPKFGGGSLSAYGGAYGNNPHARVSYNSVLEPEGGDFTIDCWLKLAIGFSGSPESKTLCGFYGNTHFKVDLNHNPSFSGPNGAPKVVLGLYASSDGSNWDLLNSSNAYGTNTVVINDLNWHHLAIVRSGNTYYTFIDGQKNLEVIAAGTIWSANEYFYIGGSPSGEGAGYIDEFRFSKGIARWTSNFVPPTQEYSSSPASFPALRFGSNEVLCSAVPSENSSLTNKLYVDTAIAGVSSAAATYKKYAYTLQSGDVSNGYVDLQDAIVHDSLVSGMNRQFMVGNGVDFSLTDVDGVTRMTFVNDFASGGDIAIATGDILYVVYRIA